MRMLGKKFLLMHVLIVDDGKKIDTNADKVAANGDKVMLGRKMR